MKLGVKEECKGRRVIRLKVIGVFVEGRLNFGLKKD